ncbi:MAG: hypothetical protein Q7T70_02655 [Polaromonas sp.]|nr:hypothetical protein [Polaromonas sp.]
MADQPTFNFIDNPHAPEIFSAQHAGIWITNGNVHITLESGRVRYSENGATLNRVVIARLVMPISGATDLSVKLFQLLKDQGASETAPADNVRH